MKKSETHIEVVILVAGVVALGGWLGMRAVRTHLEKRNPPAPAEAETAPTAASPTPKEEPARLPATRIMTAPATKPENPPPAVRPASMTAPQESAAPATPERREVAVASILPVLPAMPAQAAPAAAPEKADAPQSPELLQARAYLAEGKKMEARAVLTRLILAAAETPARDELRRLLDEINKELFWSRNPSSDCFMYTIQRGDTLSIIARNQNKDVYFAHTIMAVNGISDPKRIQAGRTLKIPQGNFSAIVQKSAHRLIVFLNGHYIKEYTVATGAPNTPTPEGPFVIDNNKMINPDWYAPDGTVHRFGDAQNILGTRWLGFKENEKGRGYGIHGTCEPDTVGKEASNGCIRMLNNEVEELFGMLQPGDPVEIVK